jgi:hypothetical protein
MELDFFGDGMRIFLDYIVRKSNRNPNYCPHSLIRAFNCALQGIEGLKEGETVAGYSQEGKSDAIYEPYFVLLQKAKNGIEVKRIRNMKVDKEIPSDIMIAVFRLQIYLDKIKGDTVNPQQFTDALNHVIPGNPFFALGNRWIEARDEFRNLLRKGQFGLPNDPRLIDELKRLRFDTPWEKYSNSLRALIGPSIIPKLGMKHVRIVITTPSGTQTEKYKVFDAAMEFLLGQSSEYFKKMIKPNKS